VPVLSNPEECLDGREALLGLLGMREMPGVRNHDEPAIGEDPHPLRAPGPRHRVLGPMHHRDGGRDALSSIRSWHKAGVAVLLRCPIGTDAGEGAHEFHRSIASGEVLHTRGSAAPRRISKPATPACKGELAIN
jgi:hypothetical protein